MRYDGICYLTAPIVTPLMVLRRVSMENTITGNKKITETAIYLPKSVPVIDVEKDDNHTGSVYFDWSFMDI